MANITDNDENQKNENTEDNFGLPDIELTPLDQKVETPAPAPTPAYEQPAQPVVTAPEEKEEDVPVFEEEETRSSASLAITLIVAIAVIAGGFLIYWYVYKPKADKEKKEQAARIEQAKKEKEEAERLAKQREEEERRKREEAANAKPAVGNIETLSAKTGRYYVVIASSVDGDLVMDQAKKMSKEGKSSKIIPPFGKWKFYRLAVADEDTFAAAQTNADGLKGQYGTGTWVIRY